MTKGATSATNETETTSTPKALRTISWGVGVQSTALVVLAAQGRIDFDTALFANVGEDSEDPLTLAYFRDHAHPWAEAHGIEVYELHRTRRDASRVSLMEKLMVADSRSIDIPVRMSNGAPGRRSCTADFKIRVIAKWIKANGATEANPATVAIGISTDEMQRVNNKTRAAYEQPVYPLIELGLDRSACQQIIVDAGLPPAPKSSCYFCPFHRPGTWAEMRRDRPELFAKSVALEKTLNDRRDILGKDHVWLTRFNMPLDQAVAEAQDTLPFAEGPEGCDEGYCWT